MYFPENVLVNTSLYNGFGLECRMDQFGLHLSMGAVGYYLKTYHRYPPRLPT